MTTPYTQDKIENWVSDFCQSDGLRPFPGEVREIAGEVLVVFLAGAAAVRDVDPSEIEELDVRAGVMDFVAPLAIPEKARPHIPGLCAALLSWLETEGRLAGGRMLGAFIKAMNIAYQQAASGKQPPITRAGSKIGRNDPCPCGSGKKYKKCCLGDN